MTTPVTERAIDDRSVVVLTPDGTVPAPVAAWVAASDLEPRPIRQADHVLAISLRARPRAFVVELRGPTGWEATALDTVRRLKRDSYSGIVPVAVFAATDQLPCAFEAGADEVLHPGIAPAEAGLRLANLVRRSDRDTDVHPSSRLPGTREIEAELQRRIAADERFAVGYADLDYFKEFNDRYGYYRGDQVIRLLARMLHDVVKGLCGPDGFVGHIGGDDFLLIVPLAALPRVCDEVVTLFDELGPLQYSEQDRRMGYFFGKDRRGQLHRVPLMTLSIGVVTNQRRRFTRAAEVSELATEMKTFAKTRTGSVWVVDRRRDEPAGGAASLLPTASPLAAPGGGRPAPTDADEVGAA